MLLAAALFMSVQSPRMVDVYFSSHDDHDMHGKLALPDGAGQFPVVIYVQTAEGMTVDMKRPDGRGGTFNYFDIYRRHLTRMGIGFYSYEGRGVENGDQPPRYETIDRTVYDTSTLSNKVLDVVSALASIRSRSEVDRRRIYLMGASEGTLIAAEAAAVVPDLFAGLALYGVMSSNMSRTFQYIMTDGAYLAYLGFFDADKDWTISKAEFEADPARYRERVLGGAAFSVFDRDGDGLLRSDDVVALTKPYQDAIASRNYAVLDQWAATAAGVATPKGWFRDHFEHDSIWTFLQRLEVPVGFFHGDLDTSCSIEGVRLMEAKAKAMGKAQFEFHYFEGYGHTLGVERYFLGGAVPPGHLAIFEYIKRITSA